MRSQGHSQNIFVRIIASPIKALGKARDMYVRSITKCGNSMSYGSYPMDGAGRFSTFSRSHSVATTSSVASDEDFAELMRVASARTLGNKIDVDLVLKQHNQNQNQNKNHKGLPKSSSVGMARIDEEKPYDSEGSVGSVLQDLYPRSRSYAVTKRINNVFSD